VLEGAIVVVRRGDAWLPLDVVAAGIRAAS
jgi:hypothetical protein